MLQGNKGRMRRRGYPIHLYVGPNGSGKSAAAVWDSMPSLDRGRPVLSTVRLLDWRNPRPCDDPLCESPNHGTHMAAHPYYIPFTNWQQLLDIEHADVIADEITGVANSRDSASLPSVVANVLVQLRRKDVVFRGTSPSLARSDVIIRECSQAITLCTGYFPVTVKDSAVDRMWRHRRLFRWITYDATSLDEFTAAKRNNPAYKGQLKKLGFELFWGPGSDVFRAYDTFDSVSTVGTVTDSGRCLACSGRRSVPACTCPDYVERAGRSARGPRLRGGADGAPVPVSDGPRVGDPGTLALPVPIGPMTAILPTPAIVPGYSHSTDKINGAGSPSQEPAPDHLALTRPRDDRYTYGTR